MNPMELKNGIEQAIELVVGASSAAGAQQATVEVTGLRIGDRIAADHAPLRGMTYEPADDSLTLFLPGLEHRIRHPKAIHLDQDIGALRSIEVTCHAMRAPERAAHQSRFPPC